MQTIVTGPVQAILTDQCYGDIAGGLPANVKAALYGPAEYIGASKSGSDTRLLVTFSKEAYVERKVRPGHCVGTYLAVELRECHSCDTCTVCTLHQLLGDAPITHVHNSLIDVARGSANIHQYAVLVTATRPTCIDGDASDCAVQDD